MNILITGPTGCIGTAIIRRGLAKGHNFTCIVHKGSMRTSNIPISSNVSVVECDLDSLGSLNIKCTFDVFIHLAWDKTFGEQRDDVSTQLKNIEYTLDACRLAKRFGCRKFIGAGSQAEYGVVEEILTPFMRVNPESGYGIAKYASGKMATLLCSQLGLEFNWVRVLSVYGPNDGASTFINYLITEFIIGNIPNVTKCEQVWDYLYSDDAADAFLAIAEKGVNGKTYVLGSGNGRKMSEYIEDIKSVINPKLKVHYGSVDYYPHQPMHLVADINELTKDTGWKPVVGFIDGIKKYINASYV